MKNFDGSSSLMASIWLVVLVVPALVLVVTEGVTGRTVAGIALLILFSAVYAVAFGMIDQWPQRLTISRRYLFWFTLLALVAVATAVVIGSLAAFLVPFFVAVLAFLAVVRMARRHASLFVLTLLLGLGIPVQAVVGGVTVLTGLNPWIVGIHFMISSAMIAMAAMLVNRTRRLSLEHVAQAELAGQSPQQRGPIRGLLIALAVFAALSIYLGTLVTGTGPHGGDAGDVVRHTFDPLVIARLHALPAYAVVALVLIGLLVGRRTWPMAVRRSLQLVGLVVIMQALIGFYQFFNGLPILVVALHLIGSALFVAVVSMAVEKGFHVTSEAPVLTEAERRDGPVTV